MQGIVTLHVKAQVVQFRQLQEHVQDLGIILEADRGVEVRFIVIGADEVHHRAGELPWVTPTPSGNKRMVLGQTSGWQLADVGIILLDADRRFHPVSSSSKALR